MCILSVYTLLKVVGYYDLSVLSMSVMGFQKKKVWIEGGWVGGWGELYPILFRIFGICLTLQSLYVLNLVFFANHSRMFLLYSRFAPGRN